jgi:4'-phosphopantetheinyl transferase
MIDDVKVWRVRLDAPAPAHAHAHDDDDAAAASVLSEDERARAARFKFDRDREAYVRAHAALRAIVGRALGVAAGEVEFTFGPHGKPRVGALELNLSHAGALALVALGPRPLGVDVERTAPIDPPGPHEVAVQYFSPAERAELARAADPLAAFYRVWTRKEAFLKATGEGLSRPLDSFDVSAGAGAALVATRPDRDEAARWVMIDLAVPAGYAAALCVAAPMPRVTVVDY